MNTALLFVGGAWIVFCWTVTVLCWNSTPMHTPKPIPTEAQQIWFRAAAKVARRRVA